MKIPNRIWIQWSEDGPGDIYCLSPDSSVANDPDVKSEVQFVRADLVDELILYISCVSKPTPALTELLAKIGGLP